MTIFLTSTGQWLYRMLLNSGMTDVVSWLDSGCVYLLECNKDDAVPFSGHRICRHKMSTCSSQVTWILISRSTAVRFLHCIVTIFPPAINTHSMARHHEIWKYPAHQTTSLDVASVDDSCIKINDCLYWDSCEWRFFLTLPFLPHFSIGTPPTFPRIDLFIYFS